MHYDLYADNELVYTTIQGGSDPIFGISLQVEVGRAGSFKFTVPPTHFFYDNFREKKTILECHSCIGESIDDIIFRGRISDSSIDRFNQKSVNCEGDLTFLSDSVLKPAKFKGTVIEALGKIIKEHNEQVDAPNRFKMGVVSLDGKEAETIEYEHSFITSLDCIESNLIDRFGGYLRTRTSDGSTYIDLVKEYGRNSDQCIEFGKNLIDLDRQNTSEDAYSILVPVGKDDTTIADANNGLYYFEIPDAVDKYGRIYKAVSFPDASSPEQLLQESKTYLKTSYEMNPTSLDISAADLSLLGAKCDGIFVGDKVRIKSDPNHVDKVYTCISIDYDLSRPAQSRYVFGRKIQDFTRRYAGTSSRVEQNTEQINRVQNGSKETASKLEKYIKATDEALTIANKSIALNAEQIALNAEQIALKASVETVEGVIRKVSQVEIDLNGDESTIGLKAQMQETMKDLNDAVVRLAKAEIDINGDKGTIGLKTQVERNNEWITKADSNFENLERRVSSAEIDINGDEGTIGLKTKVETVNRELGQRITNAEILIDGANSRIDLKADKILLDGYVTANRFNTEIASLKNGFAYKLATQHLGVGGSFTLMGYQVSPQTKKICTQVHYSKEAANIVDKNGVGHYVITSVKVWGDYEDLFYTGY